MPYTLDDTSWMELYPTDTQSSLPSGYPPIVHIHSHPRLLAFPRDRVMGKVCVRPWNQPEASLPSPAHSPWKFLAPARGDVVVPADHEAHLAINRAAGYDLAPLMHLGAFDLQSLAVNWGTVADAQLQFIEHLTGLYDVSLTAVQMTLAGLRHVVQLPRLQRLRLANSDSHLSLTDASLLLLQSLPLLRVLELIDVPLHNTPFQTCLALHSLRLSSSQPHGVPGLDTLHLLAPELRSLQLHVNQLTDATILTLAALTRLEELYLLVHGFMDVGQLTAVGLQALAHLPHLRDVRFCNIHVQTLAPLQVAPGLETLLVSLGTNDRVVPQLGQFPALRFLRLLPTDRSITPHELRGLATSQSLERLMLGEATFAAGALAGLAGLGTLRDLRLQDSSITDSDIASLAALPSLEVLDVAGTEVSDSGIRVLRSLTNLCAVDLSYTRVTGGAMRSLGALTHLRELRLCGIVLTPEDVPYLAHLAQLEQLYFACANVTSEELQVFTGLHQLKELALDGLPAGALVHLTFRHPIEWLGLGDATLAAADVAALAALPRLQTLVLHRVQLTDDAWAVLGKLTQLCNLQVGASNIQDQHLPHLLGLKQLRKLDLRDTAITDASLPVLGQMTQLEDLDLRNTQIGPLALTYLPALEALQRLSVTGTRLEREDEQELLRRLPNVWR